MPAISCDTNPTPRSEKARLRNRFLTLAGIDGALKKALITKIFPRLVTRENAKCETQREKRKVFCNGQVVENLSTFNCSTFQPFYILPVVFQAFYLSHPFSIRFLK